MYYANKSEMQSEGLPEVFLLYKKFYQKIAELFGKSGISVLYLQCTNKLIHYD